MSRYDNLASYINQQKRLPTDIGLVVAAHDLIGEACAHCLEWGDDEVCCAREIVRRLHWRVNGFSFANPVLDSKARIRVAWGGRSKGCSRRPDDPYREPDVPRALHQLAQASKLLEHTRVPPAWIDEDALRGVSLMFASLAELQGALDSRLRAGIPPCVTCGSTT